QLRTERWNIRIDHRCWLGWVSTLELVQAAYGVGVLGPGRKPVDRVGRQHHERSGIERLDDVLQLGAVRRRIRDDEHACSYPDRRPVTTRSMPARSSMPATSSNPAARTAACTCSRWP